MEDDLQKKMEDDLQKKMEDDLEKKWKWKTISNFLLKIKDNLFFFWT